MEETSQDHKDYFSVDYPPTRSKLVLPTMREVYGKGFARGYKHGKKHDNRAETAAFNKGMDQGTALAKFLDNPFRTSPTVKQLEMLYCEAVLKSVNHNSRKASQILGISIRTLFRIRKQLGLHRTYVRNGAPELEATF